MQYSNYYCVAICMACKTIVVFNFQVSYSEWLSAPSQDNLVSLGDERWKSFDEDIAVSTPNITFINIYYFRTCHLLLTLLVSMLK